MGEEKRWVTNTQTQKHIWIKSKGLSPSLYPKVSRGTRMRERWRYYHLWNTSSTNQHIFTIEGFSYQGFLKLPFLNNTIQMLSYSEQNMQNYPNEKGKRITIILMPFFFFFFPFSFFFFLIGPRPLTLFFHSMIVRGFHPVQFQV